MEWYENEGRLLQENISIKEQYPQFEMDSEEGNIILKGALTTNRGNFYALKVIYDQNYPRSEPQVHIEGAEIDGEWYNVLPWFNRSRVHMYSDSHICWNDRNRVGTWNPSKSTAVVALNTVAVWLFCYESYVFDNESWLGSDH